MQYITKKPAEVMPLEVNFGDLVNLAGGETISTATFTVTVIKGSDVNSATIIAGIPTITYGIVKTMVQHGVVDVVYQIACTITTSQSNTYEIVTELSILDHTTARQKFADFCLRQLGAPVINIEVADEQINDCIDLAIKYFHEYHFDGIERDYLIYRIQGTQITVANGAIFNKGDTLMSLDRNTTALIHDVVGNTLITNRQMGYDKFTVGQTVQNMSTGATTTVSSIVLGDPDLGYIPASDTIVGVKRLLNITSILGSSDYMFNVQYQIMMSEIQNLTSAGTAYFYGVQQYLGHLDFIMKKEKDFRFNRRMNRLYLDVSWGNDVKVGDIVVAEIYRALDETAYPEIYDDIWLQRYTTALIKKLWGSNLRKYQGMQLPGGITFNGDAIYQEAVDDIKGLEAEAIYSTSPLLFEVG